ncbi:peroxidase 5 [Tanacetum coccineum]
MVPSNDLRDALSVIFGLSVTQVRALDHNQSHGVCRGSDEIKVLADSVKSQADQTGGYGYDVPAGRRDGVVSLIGEMTRLPPPTFNLSQLTEMFESNELISIRRNGYSIWYLQHIVLPLLIDYAPSIHL